MLGSRTRRLMVALAVAMAACLPAALLANGAAAPTPPTTTTPPAETGKGNETVTPPSGRGPTEAAAPITIAPIATIRQRGHVDNAGEAQAMMMQFVKEKGGQRTAGDYQVAYVLEAPEGWYEMREGKLTWRPPAPGETQHIEIMVLDSLTGQPVPVSPITVDVMDQQGSVVQSQQLTYYWHPMADHYGANFSIPNDGTYSLRIRAPAPEFRRHDQKLGERFTTALDTTLTNVRITPKSPQTPTTPGGTEGTTPGATPNGGTTAPSGPTEPPPPPMSP